MSKMHVLDGGTNNVYSVVVHTAVPAGNNAAGTPWATALINSKRNTTIMTIGTGAGQITQAEADQIAAGTVLEGSFIWQDDPTWTNAQRTADLDLRAQQMVSDLTTNTQNQLKYFGITRA